VNLTYDGQCHRRRRHHRRHRWWNRGRRRMRRSSASERLNAVSDLKFSLAGNVVSSTRLRQIVAQSDCRFSSEDYLLGGFDQVTEIRTCANLNRFVACVFASKIVAWQCCGRIRGDYRGGQERNYIQPISALSCVICHVIYIIYSGQRNYGPTHQFAPFWTSRLTTKPQN
jgi:hypothetical protein